MNLAKISKAWVLLFNLSPRTGTNSYGEDTAVMLKLP